MHEAITDDERFEKLADEMFVLTVEFLGGTREQAMQKGYVPVAGSGQDIGLVLDAIANITATILVVQPERWVILENMFKGIVSAIHRMDMPTTTRQ
jgi:hypothetical protein